MRSKSGKFYKKCRNLAKILDFRGFFRIMKVLEKLKFGVLEVAKEVIFNSFSSKKQYQGGYYWEYCNNSAKMSRKIMRRSGCTPGLNQKKCFALRGEMGFQIAEAGSYSRVTNQKRGNFDKIHYRLYHKLARKGRILYKSIRIVLKRIMQKNLVFKNCLNGYRWRNLQKGSRIIFLPPLARRKSWREKNGRAMRYVAAV